MFKAPINERGVWAVRIRSVGTGEELYSLNAGKLMMPASNMKILTVSAAAERLGWDYRFTTTLETRGRVSDGVLHGDLVVRGSGDPTINSRERRAELLLDDWSRALKADGIQSIDGRIIGDDQAFDDEGIGAGWAWDYLQSDYAAPVGALQFNEDVAALTIAPSPEPGRSAIINLEPGSGLELLNLATTGAPGSQVSIDFRRHLDRPVLEVTGSIPAAGPPEKRSVAVVNPTIFFAQSLKEGLVARGIPVGGAAVDFDDVAGEFMSAADNHNGVTNPTTITAIASTESPPLRDIATVLMKVSQNLYAETLLKALGVATGGLGTAEAGRVAVRNILSAWKIPDDSYVQYDGSGLSRYNYVTVTAVSAILEHMYADPRHRDAFLATLPIAGRDGTIANRLRRTRAEGNVLAKTGSISNARALSGFVKTRDGELLVFSIIANDFVIPSATITWIADLGVEILSNFTRK